MIELMPLFRKRSRTLKGTRKGVDETTLNSKTVFGYWKNYSFCAITFFLSSFHFSVQNKHKCNCSALFSSLDAVRKDKFIRNLALSRCTALSDI